MNKTFTERYIQKITGMDFAKMALVCMLFAGLMFRANHALALTPTVSLANTGNSDYVQLTVTGDANAPVLLYYTKTGVGLQLSSLGTSNSNGSLVSSISSSVYGIAYNSLVHVVVNGQSSSDALWPYNSGTGNSTISLSQNSVTLSPGQVTLITVTNTSSSAISVLSNSNPSVASISLSGNQLTVNASAIGSTFATICAQACTGLSVTVQGSSGQTLSFSSNNIAVSVGQTVSVTVTGGSGSYYVLSNSNPSVAQATVSGSTINVNAVSSGGSTSITVCATGGSSCGLLYVTSGGSNSVYPTFSQSNPSVLINQSLTVSIYSSSGGPYYVSSNSNSSVVQPNISGNTITLFGNTTGSTIIGVCVVGQSQCGYLTVTVGTSSNATLSLSQTNLNMQTAQTSTIIVSGGSQPYRIPTTVNQIAQLSLNGNAITVYAVNSGSTSFQICSSDNTNCALLYVTVTGTGSTTQISLSQSSVSLGVGQNATVTVSGNGTYYVSSNSNQNVVTAQINGSNLVLYGVASGSATVTVCQNNPQQCVALTVTVGGTTYTVTVSPASQSVSAGGVVQFSVTASGFINPTYSVSDSFSGTSLVSSNINTAGTFAWIPATRDVGVHSITVTAYDSYGHSGNATSIITVLSANQGSISGGHVFAVYLYPGMTGNEVVELQKVLLSQGFFSGSATGYYGPLTTAAVKKFQTSHGLSALGVVGPATRAALNKITKSSASSQGATGTSQQILDLQAQLQALQAQLQLLRGGH